MALFHIAVLIPLTRLDGLGLQTIVLQQGLVTLLEGLWAVAAWLNGGR